MVGWTAHTLPLHDLKCPVFSRIMLIVDAHPCLFSQFMASLRLRLQMNPVDKICSLYLAVFGDRRTLGLFSIA